MSTRDYMSESPPAGRRLPYGSAPEQFGDLRLPAGGGPHPVVVVIHGGWWRSIHDLTYAGHLSAALTAAGFATWNIEYRRIGNPGGGFPGTLEDAAAALLALRTLAPEHDLDLRRIIVTGHSAGGHLAAWLAAAAVHPQLAVFGSTLPVAGVVAVGAVLDLDLTSELRVSRDGLVPVHLLLGGTHDDVPDRYALASPAQLLPLGIPLIAIHGEADDAVPIVIARRYIERARAAGDPARLVALPGVDHYAPFDPTAAAGAIVIDAIRTLGAPATDPPQAGLQQA